MVAGHSSVKAHLATEYSLLFSLYERSKAQHRHQLFLRRLEAILRLNRLVVRQYAACSESPGTGVSSASGTATPGLTPGLKSGSMTPLASLPQLQASDKDGIVGGEGEERLRELVKKMLKSLLLAADITGQMLALHHFVPLQTMLISSYGRLFAICVHLCPILGLQLGDVLSGAETRDLALLAKAGPRTLDEPRSVKEFDSGAVRGAGGGAGGGEGGGGGDLGEVISREALLSMSVEQTPTPVASPKPQPKTALSEKKKKSKRPQPEPEPECESEAELQPAKIKKKKKSDMDDTFSTSTSTSTSTSKPKKKKDAVDDIFAMDKPPKKNATLTESPAPPKKPEKKKKADDSLDDIFSSAAPKKSKTDKTKKGDKPKKKRKDAMDDIFGF